MSYFTAWLFFIISALCAALAGGENMHLLVVCAANATAVLVLAWALRSRAEKGAAFDKSHSIEMQAVAEDTIAGLRNELLERDQLIDLLNAALDDEDDDVHPDVRGVNQFARAMKAKLAACRDKGRDGWDDPVRCPDDSLVEELVRAVTRGDPVDVGNFAMMIHQRGISVPFVVKAARGAIEYVQTTQRDAHGAEASE